MTILYFIAVLQRLAVLRAFCQWKTNHQVRRRCVKGLMLTLSLHWPDCASN